jgi:hypothetical protein
MTIQSDKCYNRGLWGLKKGTYEVVLEKPIGVHQVERGRESK